MCFAVCPVVAEAFVLIRGGVPNGRGHTFRIINSRTFIFTATSEL